MSEMTREEYLEQTIAEFQEMNARMRRHARVNMALSFLLAAMALWNLVVLVRGVL